jgi:hypothetical protein
MPAKSKLSEVKLQKLRKIAARYLPASVTVSTRKIKGADGAAFFNSKRIYAPRVVDHRTLFIFLHECAHFHLGHHSDEIHSPQREFEAEKWAIHTMRSEGLTVSREIIRQAKINVADSITDSGGKAAPHIKRWVNSVWKEHEK